MSMPGDEMVAPPVVAERRPRRFAVGEIVAWVLIVAMIVVVVVLTMKAKSAGGPREAGSQLLLSSRYVVGVHELYAGMGAGKTGPLSGSDLVDSLEKSAKSPEDRLRLAIVEGELVGVKEAVERAEAVGAKNPEMKGDVEALKRLYAPVDATQTQPETPAGQDLQGETATADRTGTLTTPAAFEKKYGWFAALAKSAGKPAGDPGRAAVLAGATRTVVGLVGIILMFLLGAAVGFVILVVGLVQLLRKKLPLHFRATDGAGAAVDRRVYVEAFSIYLVGMVLLGAVMRHVLNLGAWSGLSLPLAFLGAVVWPFVRGQRLGDYVRATGLHVNQRGIGGILREMALGLAGYLAGLPLVVMGMALTILLTKLFDADPSHPLTEQLGTNSIGIILAFLLASVWAPISEELMFRGMLFANLRDRFGWWISAPVVAFVFAIIHPQGVAAVPVLGAIAIVFAGIREWRGSLVGSMTAHAIHNGVAVVFMVLAFS